jgi:mono/diheme cytochrome c family protein
MADQDLRPLLAIARAKLTLGLLLLLVAITVMGWGVSIDDRPQNPPGCGVVDHSERDRPVKAPFSAAYLAYHRGEKLFKQNCASCHKPDKTMTGPALKGARERWAKSGGDIHAWVRNSLGYLKTHPRDAYAQALFKEFNGSIMTPNAVSEEDIDAILDYADNYRRY